MIYFEGFQLRADRQTNWHSWLQSPFCDYKLFGVLPICEKEKESILFNNENKHFQNKGREKVFEKDKLNCFLKDFTLEPLPTGACCRISCSNFAGEGMNPISQFSLTLRPIHQLASYFSNMCRKSPILKLKMGNN